jgi:predicted nuclease with RNAse H fold
VAARTVLGIDLGGALQATTGYAVLAGAREPKLLSTGVIASAKSADEGERRLLELLETHRPDLVAVDAPLTLPPCLTCPSSCQGPAPDQCELESARLIWQAGGNPVTERLCEIQLRQEIGGGKPLPTMRIGQISARGSALARRLRARRAERGATGGPDLIEVYPTASLKRLGFPDKPAVGKDKKAQESYRRKVLKNLGPGFPGPEASECVVDGHAFDGLVAAYTGWLWPDGLDAPSQDFNAASGWIWLPRPEGKSPRVSKSKSAS